MHDYANILIGLLETGTIYESLPALSLLVCVSDRDQEICMKAIVLMHEWHIVLLVDLYLLHVRCSLFL